MLDFCNYCGRTSLSTICVWCEEALDLERAEQMINEIARHSSEPYEWKDGEALIDVDEQNAGFNMTQDEFDTECMLSWPGELDITEMSDKVCPMLSQLTVYLNELEHELDAAEASLVYDPEFSNSWWQLLVLRGERVSQYDGTDCEFNHYTSGHGVGTRVNY